MGSGDEAKVVVLVVQDFSTRKALSGLLMAAGIEPLPVASGLELVSRMRVDRPALVVVDRDEIFCDPLSLVHSVAGGHASFPQTPVAVLSSSRSLEDMQAYLEAGAADFFTKPLRPGSFIRRVQEILRSNDEESVA
ncbi:MAG: hypothetical protein P1V51_20385 [Deltaproteobacteria bacterium]|nr:hypothetical protein [Deltaproteobacteria bacterium]